MLFLNLVLPGESSCMIRPDGGGPVLGPGWRRKSEAKRGRDPSKGLPSARPRLCKCSFAREGRILR